VEKLAKALSSRGSPVAVSSTVSAAEPLQSLQLANLLGFGQLAAGAGGDITNNSTFLPMLMGGIMQGRPRAPLDIDDSFDEEDDN
jgi:hypothetical protein